MKTPEKILLRGDSTYQCDTIPSIFKIQDWRPSEKFAFKSLLKTEKNEIIIA